MFWILLGNGGREGGGGGLPPPRICDPPPRLRDKSCSNFGILLLGGGEAGVGATPAPHM